MPEPDEDSPPQRHLSAVLHEQLAARRAIAEQAISLAHLLGRPVFNDVGTRVGKVGDIVVRWETGVTYPPVIGVLIPVGRGFVMLDQHEVRLSQTGVRMRSERPVVSRVVRREGDVALARDVLDHQLVDIAGVQVVRAADVYLLNGPRGWELAGIDVGLRSLLRRLLIRRRRCPPPSRAIDWAQLHAFVPRFSDTASAWEPGPAVAAGAAGSGVQLGGPAAKLKTLRAVDVAAILADLPRHQQAQVAAHVAPSVVAEALTQLDEAHREALLAELDEPDRARLQALMDGDAP